MKKYPPYYDEPDEKQFEQVYEDSDVDDDFNSKNWPNEKLLWIRLGACILVGLAIAVTLVSLLVIGVNKIMGG